MLRWIVAGSGAARDVSRTPHIQTQRKYEILADMGKNTEASDKFVRVKLTGEIVEVVGFDSADIMINYRGKTLTMGPHEISRISPEEAAALAEKRNSGLDLR
jgi:hypothetical protein